VIGWILVIDHGVHLEDGTFLQIAVWSNHPDVLDEIAQGRTDDPWVGVVGTFKRPHANGITKLIDLDNVGYKL
jgi:hypothetical protein